MHRPPAAPDATFSRRRFEGAAGRCALRADAQGARPDRGGESRQALMRTRPEGTVGRVASLAGRRWRWAAGERLAAARAVTLPRAGACGGSYGASTGGRGRRPRARSRLGRRRGSRAGGAGGVAAGECVKRRGRGQRVSSAVARNRGEPVGEGLINGAAERSGGAGERLEGEPLPGLGFTGGG